jgi:hypothetical protein
MQLSLKCLRSLRLFLGVGLFVFSTGCSQSPLGVVGDAGSSYNSLMDSAFDAELFVSGKVLYERNDCAFCHGQFPGRAFGNHTPEQINEDLLNGAFSKVSDMRYLSSISGDDRAQIAYALRFWKQGTSGLVEDPESNTQPPTEVPSSATLAEKSRLILSRHCLSCHGTQPVAGAFGNILDTQAQIRSGRIRPGNSPGSPLVLKVADGSMPKNQQPLNSEDLVILIKWINSMK